MTLTDAVISQSAVNATLCSFLGLSARDLAEIGGFSDSFARELLAGQRPFPQETQSALEQLLDDFERITQAFAQEMREGERRIYIYRTNEQLRASPVGRVWPARGRAAGGFIGAYRAAVFNAWRNLQNQGINAQLIFAETPEVS